MMKLEGFVEALEAASDEVTACYDRQERQITFRDD